MYFYITTRLNQGYKVGITNDVEKRQQQYTTLIPNIDFHLYVQTSSAEEIEKSFKKKFNDYRVVNKTSSKHMKSEVYQVKLKYLLMHFINCMHMKQYATIITDKQTPFTTETFLKNKMSFYLSNYYLPYANYNTKFYNFNYRSEDSTSLHIKIGEIEVDNGEFKDEEVHKHSGKLTFYDLNLDDWKKIVSLYFENTTKISQKDFDKIIEKLKITKKTENVSGQYAWNYVSPWEEALAEVSRKWFNKFIDFKVLRNYSIERLNEPGGFTKNISGSALSGSPQYLKFFGYPYPLNSKLQLELPEYVNPLK